MESEPRTVEEELTALQHVVEAQRKRLIHQGIVVDRLYQERNTMKNMLEAICIAKLKEIQESPDGLMSQADDILREMG